MMIVRFMYYLGVNKYVAGAEALVSCGMMESLLKVINWYGQGQDHITVRMLNKL